MTTKDIIKRSLRKVQRINKVRTANYKKALKEKIRVNITTKKQSQEQNEGLIRRFYNAKEKPLNVMQSAFQQAL